MTERESLIKDIFPDLCSVSNFHCFETFFHYCLVKASIEAS